MAAFFPSTAARSKTDVKKYHRPLPRYGHLTNIIGDKMFLWCGGQNVIPIVHNGAEKESFMSAIETFNLRSGRWECRPTRGYSPAGIQYYATACLGTDLYYFGGHCGHASCYYNSVNHFETTIYKWNDIKIKNLFDAPMMKYSCGMVGFRHEDNRFLFVVGGYGEFGGKRQPGASYLGFISNPNSGRTNEQHILSLKEGMWINPTITGDIPPPCSAFTFTSIGQNQAVLFGGYQGTGGRSSAVYIAQLTKDSVHWTKISKPVVVDESWPVGRCDHAAVCILGHIGRQAGPLLLIAGGIDNSNQILRDCWIFAIDTAKWMKIEVPASIVGRVNFSMSVMNIGTRYAWVILFGGATSWEKGKSTREQALVSDTAVLELGWNIDTKTWSIVSVIESSTLAESYQLKLKERLHQRQKSA